MKGSGTRLARAYGLTGEEREALEAVLREGASRDTLRRELSYLDPPRNYDDFVKADTSLAEINGLVGAADRGGWIGDLVGAFAAQTERDDLIGRAEAIRDALAARPATGPVPGDPSGRRMRWPATVFAVSALFLAVGLGGSLYIFRCALLGRCPPQNPNFVLRFSDENGPAAQHEVSVEPIVGEGGQSQSVKRVTNENGEAYFRIDFSTATLYRGEIYRPANSHDERCPLPAFSSDGNEQTREYIFERLWCRQVRDRTTPAAVATDEGAGLRFVSPRSLAPERQLLRTPRTMPPSVDIRYARPPIDVRRARNSLGLPIGSRRRERPLSLEPARPITPPIDVDVRRARAPLGVPSASGRQFQDTLLEVDHLAYTLGFDPQLRLARWVAFAIDPLRTFRTPRSDMFVFDPKLPEDMQTGNDAYRRNLYDRGMLLRRWDAAQGDTREDATASEAQAFYYSAVIPQPAATNQNTWLHVEDWATEGAETHGPYYTVSGPVFPDRQNSNDPILVIGPESTVVPIAIFRVHLRRGNDGAWSAIAFVAPNDGTIENDPLVFVTSVAAVEAQTGLTFFPELTSDQATRLKANADPDVFLQ